MGKQTVRLSEAIDHLIAWSAVWHRLVFFREVRHKSDIDKLIPFEEFSTMLGDLPHDQPAFERLMGLHDHLKKISRLVLLKIIDGEEITRPDYELVVQKYQELMMGLRRVEQALSLASSSLDPLTGIRNRQGLIEDLSKEISRFSRTGKSFCLVVMDIDHFKSINDGFGHDAGDEVLVIVADLVVRSVRLFDDVYRYGGEEFLMCLKEVDERAGALIIERLRQALEQQTIVLSSGEQINLTASFGLSVCHKDTKPEDLIACADQALYQAKSSGRNQVVRAGDPSST